MIKNNLVRKILHNFIGDTKPIIRKENSFPCPSCGFLVFSEPIGSYEICHICNWEDDDVQLKYPGMRGGANTSSLKEYQDLILKEIPVDVREYKGNKRDLKWRPLKENEIIDSNKGTGKNYFHAAGENSPDYYWLNERQD